MQQIIYTRCKPKRELRDGRVINQEGYAIYNFSGGLIADQFIMDVSFLEKRIPKRDAAVEGGKDATGIFCSYDYFYDPDGGSLLGQENLRPYHAADVRPNGMTHRPGNYIKQYMVGEFENYPCLLFGSACWDAAKKTENSYYHDNGEPLEFLPELEPKYASESVLREKVRGFISDGRADCVRKLISAVITEMSKPMDERRFIVIRDFPENVEMWVAAVEFAMPVYLARQISFSTNVAAGDRLSDDNTFYRNAEDKFISKEEAREAGGKKSYHSMIVGIHPLDKRISLVDPERDGETFWLLDGQKMVFDIPEALDIGSAYFNAAVQMDKEICSFIHILSALAPLKFGDQAGDIFELFDACYYLFYLLNKQEKGEYERIARSLSVFGKYEKEPFQFSQSLAEKVYEKYRKFYKEDERAGLALLKQIISMDRANKLKEKVKAYLLENYLYELKTDNINIDRVNRLGKEYSEFYYPSMKTAVDDEFKKSIPVFINYAKAWDSEQSYHMFCKLYDCFRTAETTNGIWYQDRDNTDFIEILFQNISRDKRKSMDMMAYVKDSPVYMYLAVKGVCSDCVVWMETVCSTMNDAKLEALCGELLKAEGITMQQYELFLTNLLIAGKGNDSLVPYLNKAIKKFGVDEDRSARFIKEYLERFGKNANKLESLADEMSKTDWGASKKELYKAVESYLDTAKADIKTAVILAGNFLSWRNELWKKGEEMPVGRADFIMFLYELRSAPIKAKDDDWYSSCEPIIIKNKRDMQMLVEAVRSTDLSGENLIKLYHIIKNSEFRFRRILLVGDESDEKTRAGRIAQYIELIRGSESAKYKGKYKEDILDIEDDLYTEIKNDNIDRLEKLILKITKKNKLYKQYFEDVRRWINDEKKAETQKLQMTREKSMGKRTKVEEERDHREGLFSMVTKLFRKK